MKTQNPEPRTPHASLRSAFSMVELMIAIMILGLGLVMVATIFPVGLDMTRETVEKSIGVAAAGNAVDTILLKIPTGHDELINASRGIPWLDPPQFVPVVLFPTPLVLPSDPKLKLFVQWFGGTSAVTDFGMENDAALAAGPEDLAYTSLTGMVSRRPYTDRDYDTNTPPNPLPVFNNLVMPPDRREIMQRSRAFTEVGSWHTSSTDTLMVIGQNVPVDFVQRAGSKDSRRPVLATEDAPGLLSPSGFSRLHLSEHVYPPLRTDDLVPGVPGAIFEDITQTTGNRWDAELALARIAADRRYSWSVLYEPLSQPRTYRLTILVLSRGELSSAYAYQRDQRGTQYTGHLDLTFLGDGSANDPSDTIFLPQPTTVNEKDSTDLSKPDREDGLFPRPWLVGLGLPPPLNASPPTRWEVLPRQAGGFWCLSPDGQALCTAEVARLMPPGATLVAVGSGGVARVTSSSYDPAELGKSPDQQNPARLQLQVDTGGFSLLSYFLVWVFPPAVQSHEPAEFGPRSPVIAAFEREVTLP